MCCRASRRPSGDVPAVITVPEPSSPLSASVRGPSAATRSSVFGAGGQSRPTSVSFTYRPVVGDALASQQRGEHGDVLTQQGHRRGDLLADLCHPVLDAVTDADWTRPGYARASVAISIAVTATLRIGTGSTPTPTLSRRLLASAMAAAEIPPDRKQSSHSHNSSRPAASAAAALAASRSGANCGRNTAPTEGSCTPTRYRPSLHQTEVPVTWHSAVSVRPIPPGPTTRPTSSCRRGRR